MNGQLLRAGIVALATLCAAPLGAQQRWRLVEDVRIGGGDDGPTSFSDISGLDVDKQGRIAIFDQKAFELRLFDKSGKFLRTVGRKGQGPGEFTDVNGIRFRPDGSLWVNDHRNTRVVGFNAAGDFEKQILLPVWGYSFRWDAVVDARGRIAETFTHTKPGADGKRERSVRRLDPATGRLDTVPVPACLPGGEDGSKWFRSWRTERGGGNVSIPFAPTGSNRLDPAGGFACARGEEYRVSVVRFDGTSAAEIRSNTSPVSIPESARDSAVTAVYKGRDPRFAIPPGLVDLSMVPGTYPRVEQIDIDDAGRIWVRRKTVSGLALDIWGRDGRQIATIDAPIHFGRFDAVVIRGDGFYTVVRDADDVPSVVRYRISR